MLKMEEFLMIRDLYNRGLNISEIARKTGYDRKTVRKYTTTQTIPHAHSRTPKPSKPDPFKDYIQQKLSEYPLTAARLCSDIREQGYTGGYTTVKVYFRKIRPPETMPSLLRYETKIGKIGFCNFLNNAWIW